MKRKILIITAIVMTMLSFAACGKKEKNAEITLKDDFIEFVGTEIPNAEKLEVEIMNKYNGYFTGEAEVDTAALLTELESNIIPKYEEFLNSVKAIETKFDEVSNLKDLYYTSMDYQLQALTKVRDALKEEEAEYQEEAASLLLQAESKYEEYTKAVTELATQNDVIIKDNNN